MCYGGLWTPFLSLVSCLYVDCVLLFPFFQWYFKPDLICLCSFFSHETPSSDVLLKSIYCMDCHIIEYWSLIYSIIH